MSTPAAPELRYGIDRLEVRGKRLFGWGWIAHPAREIESITLRVSGDGWERALSASTGRTRDDVAAAFPELVNAKFSGFMVTGYADRAAIRSTSTARFSATTPACGSGGSCGGSPPRSGGA